MMGFQVSGPSYLFIDNKSVIISTTLPSSVLKKKHQFIAWQKIWEAHAAGIIQGIHINGEDNYSDILTKGLGPARHYNLCKGILFGRKRMEIQGELQET